MNLEKQDKSIFYNIDEKFYFVDLPGYGYSKMSKKNKNKLVNLLNNIYLIDNKFL